MGNEVTILEKQLAPLAPSLAEALGRTMPVERLIRTVVLSAERLPKLLACDRQSLFNAAMSAAVLGLEVDGVTGQAFLIPFKGRAQLVIGYKGYNTMAARSGIAITGAVVREGDEFDYELGDKAFVRHKPKLGNIGRIVGAWACAASLSRPAVVSVMGIDELNAVKAKSPAVRGGADTPWNDPSIGFPAMCEKTVKRRLARSLPLNVMQLAARMDEAVDEEGRGAWINPDKGVVVDGEVIAPREASPTPTFEQLTGPAGDAADRAPAPTSAPQAQGAGASVLSAADQERLAWLDGELAEAAKKGWQALADKWEGIDPDDQKHLRDNLNNKHKPVARQVRTPATA